MKRRSKVLSPEEFRRRVEALCECTLSELQRTQQLHAALLDGLHDGPSV